MPSAHLVGIFPRSEQVVEVSRAVDRGRAAPEVLDAALAEDERRIIALQREAGLDYITDGLVRWQDLLRPLSDGIPGMHAGGIVRWFDNNTFFRHPVITGPLEPTGRAVLAVMHLPALDGTRWKAILPSPFALAALAENAAGRSPSQVLDDAAAVLRAEAHALAAAGCAYIQFSDPVLVTRATREDVGRARDALARVTDGLAVRTGLHTYFGDAGPWLADLMRFPTDEIGVDLFASNLEDVRVRAEGKTLLVGALDGRNSLVEEVEDLVDQVIRLRNRLEPTDVALVPNCDLEFLPWACAEKKVRRLGEAAAALREVLG